MSDQPFELLLQAALSLDVDKKLLWVVDENITADEIIRMSTVRTQLNAITNRFDIYQQLINRDIDSRLSDFDFSNYSANSFDAVLYRVSKEKPVVHYVINSSAILLKANGQLLLSGYKNEGIKTYVDKASKYLGEAIDKQKGSNSALLVAINYLGEAQKKLDDKNYTTLIELDYEDASFVSKPGVYGWNKIDKGSAFLVDQLPQILDTLPSVPKTVADIGCGFGFLSVMTNALINAEFIATDNNVASVGLCKKNFEKNNIEGEVILDDCAESIQKKADLVVCNPPFHQGFAIEGELTQRFLQAAKRLLKPQGVAVFVVNSFIPLERKAQGIFDQVVELKNNRSFKVLLLK